MIKIEIINLLILKIKFMKNDFSKFSSKRILFSTVMASALFAVSPQAVFADVNEVQAVMQTGTVKGQIVDANGEPVIGASVLVKGTSNGTITDFDGNFSLNDASKGTLVISYIGYKTQEVAVKGKSLIKIVLQEDAEVLDEVVVVGYGTQKKATLSGSVTQVKGDDVLKGKSTTSVASALQGEIPGLTITRTSSRPGNEDMNISIRGGISVNKDGNKPMIVIDGIEAYEWELSQINPNDIENISVLKDAAAAIYGTRASGGVILITTKRGKEGKVKVTYSGNVHANIVGNKFPVTNGIDYARMNIDATESDAQYNLDKDGNPVEEWFGIFTKDQWYKIAEGTVFEEVTNGAWHHIDPYVDLMDEMYGTTLGHSHNVTISGGSEKIKVMTSIGFADDRSLLKVAYDGQKKYNFRTNVDYQLGKYVKTQFNVSYDNRKVSTPTQGVGNGLFDPYLFPTYNPSGQFYDTFGGRNPIAFLQEGGRSNNREEILRVGAKFDIDLSKITQGLSVTGNVNFKLRKGLNIQRSTTVTTYDWAGELGLENNVFYQTPLANRNVKNTHEENTYQNYGAFLNYTRGFDGHNIGFMGGVTVEKNDYMKMYQYRKGMTDDSLDDINTGDASTAEATGGSNDNALVSYLGRLNYDYKGTFLLEGLFRRDGSSKFAPDHRWANFMGVSGGVRLSELQFVKDWNTFDNLKIRASYGETGSQAGIGNYDYVAGIATGTTIFGYTGEKYQTAYINGVSTTEKTWERVSTTNFGVDFAVLNNRLSGSFDYFIRKNDGMLIKQKYPATFGADAPYTNSGSFRANGWELALNWQDKIGADFSYKVGVSLSDAKTKILTYGGAEAITCGYKNNNPYDGGTWIAGKPLNAIYVYKTDGYLQNEADVTEYYKQITQQSGGLQSGIDTKDRLTPGCVRKVDLSDDGRITTDDLYYYGDSNPHYQFGLTLGASYKNFDFNMFIQGVGQQYILRDGTMAGPFWVGYQNQNSTFLGNTWTVDNTDARYPVMSRNGARNNWNYKWYNDINVNNCWYARAKNIVLGYTLSKSVVSKLGIENLRCYLSADNLFEISNVKDGFDPENKTNTGNGNAGVFARTISFGLDVTF